MFFGLSICLTKFYHIKVEEEFYVHLRKDLYRQRHENYVHFVVCMKIMLIFAG